jgi:uncharacterized protein YecE (DUF72 family)
MGTEWRIGCSGYHYADWKGIFYPEALPSRKWFEYYCDHFNTIELNVTYYKFPRVDTLKRWYGRSPKDFDFTVKAPRNITHSRKFGEAERLLSDFYSVVKEGLREKLGCVLFQFPSGFHFDAGRLAGILRMLDGSLPNVLEFRHKSWWTTEVLETLARSRATFCGMSHPDLPENVVSTSDTVYYRFLGIPHVYNTRYELPALERVRQEILNAGRAARAFLYFNNTADAHAVMNAKQLQSICELVH